MAAQARHRPALLHALMVVLAFQGLSGVAGGYGLSTDPSGRAVGIPAAWLTGSPFRDFLVPGLVLLTLLGIGPLLVVYGLWTRRTWAWKASLAVGVALLVWLGVEIAVIGYRSRPPLQAVYGGVAVAILVLTLAPPVREYFRGGAAGRI